MVFDLFDLPQKYYDLKLAIIYTFVVMKNNLFDTSSRIVITCPKKITPYLRKELEDLSFPIDSESMMSIETHGTLSDCMKLNLHLKTATRVLYHIKSFPAKDPNDLYTEVKKIPWEEYVEEDGYISVVSHSDNPEINDSRFPNLKCKDAIVDRLMELKGRRPDSGPDKNKAVLYLYWKDNEGSMYIDSSGEIIAKHGYRKIPFKAPLQESLASAIIMASKWDKNSHFINPMCGSGTLAIEAALIAQGRAPGLLRSNFAFMHIKGFPSEAWEMMRREARLSSRKELSFKIIASDMDEEAISVSKKNAATAGVDHLIDFIVCDFKETPVPEGSGVVVLNPEYGERLGEEEELEGTYKAIGDFFKTNCKGYTGYIFTGNMNLAKKIGLKAKRKIEFYNSKIECRLMEYELYAGSRRVVVSE